MSALLPKADIRPRDQDVCFGPLAEAGTILKALDYSDEGCQPTFFNVIPDKSNVDAPFKFTARISRTTPLAFSSRTVLARLTNAASESPPLQVPRISPALR